MSEFLQRVESEIQSRRLLPPGRKILVAVSGGADSLGLLHALHLLAPKHRWRLSVAHFNHQLRGRASDADERFVRARAQKLSLPFFCERGDVAGFSRRSKLSVEMAARQLRHEFLARVARRQKISVIALAHHADDQVELFFLRLLRGAGGEGLAGMKWRSPSPAAAHITLVRPLLGFSKAELLAYVRANNICFRADATNLSNDFLRNRIRNELLPLLRKNYQPGLSKAVLRLMEIVGDEAEFVAEAAGQWTGGNFSGLAAAVQRKVLRARLNQLGIVSDFDLIEHLRSSPGKFVSLNPALSIACSASGKLSCREHREAAFKTGERKLELSGRPGRAEFGGVEFRWRVEPMKSCLRPRPKDGVEFFDAASLGGEIVLRHWRAGDRFQPIGLKSPVKLQDLFVNAKIPALRRRALVLAATAAGEIFWVEGLRMGEPFKLTGRTKARLAWDWSKGAS